MRHDVLAAERGGQLALPAQGLLRDERVLLAEDLAVRGVGHEPRAVTLVAGDARGGAEATHRLDHALPGELAAHGGEARRALRIGWRVEKGEQRRGHGVGVTLRDQEAEPMALDQGGQVVAAAQQHRQTRPEVVEHAGAKGELCLDPRLVQAHPDVALQ